MSQIPSGFVQVHQSEFTDFVQYQARVKNTKEQVSLQDGLVKWLISGCVIAITRKQVGDTQAYFIAAQ